MGLPLSLNTRYAKEIHFTHPVSVSEQLKPDRSHDDRLSEFIIRIGVHPGYLRSSFLFNFVFEMISKVAVYSCENSGTNICADKKLSDVEFVTDVVLLIEDSRKLQTFLDCTNDSVGLFGMCFVRSKCKMLLHD